MLSAADADLVARESAVPGLGTLLDPDAFADRLRSSFPQAPIVGARARYARYKPATNCLVAYVVDFGGQEIDVYAKAYGAASSKLDKSRRHMTAAGPFGRGGVILDDLAVAVYAYPNDRELALLPEIAGAETRTHRLSRLVPDRPGLWQAKPQRLSYKPERRYVARLVTDNGADAVLRVYNGSDYHHASSAVHAFTSREHVRVARCVARSDRGHALVLDWLSGQPLDQACLSLSFDVRCVQNVAAALAELHAQDGNSLTAVTPDAQTRTLVAAADAIASVCPQLARRAHRLAGKLESRLSEPSPPPRPIHGDFSADQVLLQDDGVGIIDFDAAIRGDPAADLGSFAAHVQREVVRDKLPAERAEAMIAELLEGYRIASRHDPTDRFRLHFAAALLHLAYSPFRYREPDWAQKAQSLLERAEEIAVNA